MIIRISVYIRVYTLSSNENVEFLPNCCIEKEESGERTCMENLT